MRISICGSNNDGSLLVKLFADKFQEMVRTFLNILVTELGHMN